jgi:cell division protein FtsW (lipid II flippase)
MFSNQISPFEYVSILISIILGLGITQILSAFTDLLYNYKKTRFYWPHTIWVIFILFLHIQDWFITYQLKDTPVWHLPELFFILLYTVSLFCVAKMLLPTNENEEQFDMKLFYKNQFPVLFIIVGISVLISILFNISFLHKSVLQQIPLIIFLLVVIITALKKVDNELLHKGLAMAITSASMVSIIVEENTWIIK